MDDDPDSIIFKPISLLDKDFLSSLLKNQKIAENFIKGSQYVDQEIDQILSTMISFQENNELGFYVVYNNKNKIGIAGFNYLKEFDEVEVVYCVSEFFWGQGFASQILKKLLEIGLKENNLLKLYGIVKEKNIASFKVLEKNGFITKKEFIENEQKFILLELNNSIGKKRTYLKAMEVGL